MNTQAASWLPMTMNDIEPVDRIANLIHPGFPERPEVFAEKLSLFSKGFSKLVNSNGTVVGYGISHPWKLLSIPPLDAFLGALPAAPDCMYMHDVAILPEARGSGASAAYIKGLKTVTRNLSLSKLACVAIYGAEILWARYGFQIRASEELQAKIKTYGEAAKYMVADIAES